METAQSICRSRFFNSTDSRHRNIQNFELVTSKRNSDNDLPTRSLSESTDYILLKRVDIFLIEQSVLK